MRGKRLQRLLQIIPLLRGGVKSWNARRLADRFECSRRNIYRDLAILELAGVPYFYDPDFGEGGGYRIRPEWWFPPVGLTEQECLDLAVMTRVAETRSVPLLDSVSEVRDKLLATLPSKQQDLIRTASELFDILGIGLADHRFSRQVMLAVQQALLLKRQLTGLYATPHKKRSVRVQLHSRRVFLCGTAWYLAAEDGRGGETKLYRLARFKELSLSDKPMTDGSAFSIREYLGNAWTVHRGDRDYYVEIEFMAEAAPLVEETRWHHTQEIEHRGDGKLIFRATVSGLEEIKYWCLQWGPRAVVRKPPELVDAVKELAESTLRCYSKH